jgi:tripartite-type tricarboxylate transporter receptor subunit TctC
MAFLSLSSAVPQLSTGKIRVVGVVEKSRYAAMPDVPTIGETVPGFAMSSWLGVFAPAGTPAGLIARLNETIDKIFGDPAVKEKLANLGLIVTPMSPTAMIAMIKAEIEARGALIKAANIQAQ